MSKDFTEKALSEFVDELICQNNKAKSTLLWRFPRRHSKTSLSSIIQKHIEAHPELNVDFDKI